MTSNNFNLNFQQKNMPFAQVNQELSVPVAGQQFSALESSSESWNQAVQDNYFSNRVNVSKEANPLVTAGISGVLWYSIAQGMDKFNPKCEGEYSKSILGRFSKIGDDFSKNTYLGRKFEAFINWCKLKFENSAKKSQIVYTLKNHSTMPEWHMAKTMKEGLYGFVVSDTEEIASKYIDPVKKVQNLEQVGASQDLIDTVAKSLKGKNKEEKLLILQKEELRLLGVTSEKIKQIESASGLQGLQGLAKDLKAKRFGFKNIAHYEALRGKFLTHPEEIMQVLERGAKNDVKVYISRSQSKIRNHLVGRVCSASEYLNKYKAALGKGNDTHLGKFMSKLFGYVIEGGTNRFAGGKIAVGMQALALGSIISNTIVAPKNEKICTFAEQLINDLIYIISMPISILSMHKLGGFKYAGLDADGVAKYKEALEAFNNKVKNNAFTNKAEYKAAKKALKDLLGTKNIKNPITKLLQKVGAFINIGNERILSYRSVKKFNLNFVRRFFNGNIIGVPMRFIIPMFIISPFIAKLAVSGSHAVFGRPTKSILDEDLSSENKNQAVHSTNGVSVPSAQTESTNLLDKYKRDAAIKTAG